MSIRFVQLTAHQPNWKLEFEKEKSKIFRVAGKQIISIDHIGSTSLKDVYGQPIIDILIGVQHLDQIRQLLKPIKSLNYETDPKPQFIKRRCFRKQEGGIDKFHLYVCEHNSDEWKDLILFRDSLQNHNNLREEYSKYKFMMSRKYKYHPITYSSKLGLFVRSA